MSSRIIVGFSGLFLILSVSAAAVFAQEQKLLTLDEAVSIGLEHNYGIKISRNNLDQAENNRSLGNAGFLPTIDLTGTRTERVENSEFNAAGISRSTKGASSSNTNASANLNWTLFDGLRMFSSYDRLGRLQDLSELQLDLEQETLVANISLSYFNIIRLSEQLKILESNIEVSKQRIEIEETKLDLGSGSEYDVLQARSDLSADSAAYIGETNLLTEAKIGLNELLARSPSDDFEVVSTITVNRSLSRDELYQNLIDQNTELAVARIQKKISGLELQEIKGERLPEIALTSAYSYNRSENNGGFIQFNETKGFSIGLTARVPIFDGFNLNRRVQNAQINQKNAELSLEQEKLRLESDFETVYRAYLNAIDLVDLEEENYKNAERTLDIGLERFRLGTISSIEFREAQTTFLQAENRLLDAKYQAKVAETQLLHLSGDINDLVIE